MYRRGYPDGFDAGRGCNGTDARMRTGHGCGSDLFCISGKRHFIITKSGGFGKPDLLYTLAKLTKSGAMQKSDGFVCNEKPSERA